MDFTVTKTWKELPYKIVTIIAPSIPGVRVCASENMPNAETGILYSGKEVSRYSEQKLWIKLPDYSSADTLTIEIQNFM